MQFTFTVSVTVERTEGKFASRDEIEEAITEWLDAANEGSVEGENGGQYDVTDWSVEASL
jgi:hypothetical protein